MTDILEILKNSNKNLFVGLAGPGTGKSYTFKKIIESKEYKDKNILISSFINKLVDGLSEDFQDFKNFKVSILHSFAMKTMGKVHLDPVLDNTISEDYFLMYGNKINFAENFFENSLTDNEETFYNTRRSFYKHD